MSSSILSQKEKARIIREAILSLNLKNGDKIPWEKLYKRVPKIYTLNSLMAFVVCNGGFDYLKDKHYFSDIVEKDGWEYIFKPPNQSPKPTNAMLCPSCKSMLVSWHGQLKCDKCGYIRIDENKKETGTHTITIKTKAITEPIENKQISTNIVDDDTMKLWKYRSLRSEQVQLMKELVSSNKKLIEQSEIQTKTLSKMLENFEIAKESQLKRLEEKKELEHKQKSTETTTQGVTA